MHQGCCERAVRSAASDLEKGRRMTREIVPVDHQKFPYAVRPRAEFITAPRRFCSGGMYKSVLRKIRKALASSPTETVPVRARWTAAAMSGLKSAFTTTWPRRTCQLCKRDRALLSGG